MDKKVQELWWRYQYLRDHGHLRYVRDAKRYEDFFAGIQWNKADLDLLRQQRRPALTINKILSTLAVVVGEQIYNRTEITFRPRKSGASDETAEALSRVFMQISDNNQLQWGRTDVYLDGLITGRGFYDVRLGFGDSLQGDVQVRTLNPKNVLIDSDASSYDPAGWNDVFVTKWLSLNEVEHTYGKKWRNELEGQASTLHPYEYDITDWDRDQFGDPPNTAYADAPSHMDRGSQPVLRVVRVLERQHRTLQAREHFVHIPTGEMRPIPEHWSRDDVSIFLQLNDEYSTVRRTAPRIRWTVGAGMSLMHDDWSPYEHFTVVPFFPYFRHGRPIGVVEMLIGAQELLNKVKSQELHVVNTTANSGWKIKVGALQNMSTAELEERGAQTGVVLELDEIDSAEKIQPNPVPTGLDRLSFQAEEYIKAIANVPDYASGFAREDVSAKALRANQVQASANYALVLDNLTRSDHYLAKVMLSLVQTYYTEERLLHITTDPMRSQTTEFTVNQVTPEGEILRDLTLGEYDIVITSQPERDTLEDSTFAQAVEMRKELGVAIPDDVLIQNSRIPNKKDVLEAINAERNSPEAQQAREIERAQALADVEKARADAARDVADAEAKRIKAQVEAQQAQHAIPPEVQIRVEAELAGRKYEVDTNAALKREEMQLRREEMEMQWKIAQLKAKEPKQSDAKDG